MLGFSLLGQFILVDFLKLPFSVMEIYYLPFLIYKRKAVSRIISNFFSKQNLFHAILILMLLFGALMGVISTANIGVVIEYRSLIYMLIILYAFRHQEVSVPMSLIMKVGMYALIGDFLFITIFSMYEKVSTANCIMMAVVILGLFIQEKYVLSIVFLGFCVVMGTISGYRIGTIVSVLCFIEGVVFMIVRNDRYKTTKLLVKRVFFLVISVVAMILLVQNYMFIVSVLAKVAGMSQFAVFRITTRMESLLHFDFVTSQDMVRSVLFKYPFERFFSGLIPRGLIGTFIGEYSLYIDVPILYLYDAFGSLFAWTIVFILLYVGIRKGGKYIITSKRKKQSNSINTTSDDIQMQILSVLVVPILLVLLTINGSFMVIVYQAIETGLLLGVLAKK